MSLMASWDWPEKWPGLVENLTECLMSEDMNLVHGAMKTLDLFASGKNLTDVHIPLLVQIVFPQLQRIFGEAAYPERIRMRAIRILHSIINWLGTIKAEYPQSVSSAVKPTLPGWYELFHMELMKPDDYGAGHGSKIGVLLVIHQILAHFPDFIKTALPNLLLEPLWTSLGQCVEIWERTNVYAQEPDNSGYDSDAGDEISFKNYLCMLVEVFTVIDERKKLQPMLSHGLVDLAYVVLRLCQLSEYQLSLFEDDPSQFLVEEDEEDPFSFSIRLQAGKLLQMLAISLDGHGVEAISAAVQKHMQELETMANGGDENVYLRRREALLFGVGTAIKSWSQSSQDLSLSGTFPMGATVADIPFDVSGIIKLILVDCESPHMILRGRALWCASIATRMLPESLEIVESDERPETSDAQVSFLVRAAIAAMQTVDAPLPFLLQAAECVTELSALLDVQTLKETISVVLPSLVALAPELQEQSLLNLLETIENWIDLDAESTAQHAGVVMDAILEAWSRNSKDPYIPAFVSSIIQRLCKIPSVLPIAQVKVGAVIHQIFADPASRDNGLVESCADLMAPLLMDAPWAQLPPLFTEELIPQLLTLMLTSVDNAMLQSGCSTLVALVRCGKGELANLPMVIEGVSSNALEFVIMVIDRILNGEELDDHAALFVGPLVSKLIDSAHDALGDRIDHILQSVVLRLERVELNTLTQDLLQVFALLMRQNLDLVLNFLCQFHMPKTGETALNFVLSYWTKTFEDRHGNYQMKVSILALSSIFGHPGLAEVVVPADAAIEDAFAQQEEAIGLRTRSKRKVAQHIPRTESLNIRIFRLMLREHMWVLEEREAPNEMSSDEDEFTLKDDVEGYSPFALAAEYAHAQDEYEASGAFPGAISLDRILQSRMNLDDEETDPDILSDPAYSLDIEQYIYDWMRNMATENVEMFDYCVSQLSSMERDHLIQKLIQSREQ